MFSFNVSIKYPPPPQEFEFSRKKKLVKFPTMLPVIIIKHPIAKGFKKSQIPLPSWIFQSFGDKFSASQNL